MNMNEDILGILAVRDPIGMDMWFLLLRLPVPQPLSFWLKALGLWISHDCKCSIWYLFSLYALHAYIVYWGHGWHDIYISVLPFFGFPFLSLGFTSNACQLRRRTLGDEAAAFRNDETLSSLLSTVLVKLSSSLPEVELGKKVKGSFSPFSQGRGREGEVEAVVRASMKFVSSIF